jgi:hypothetical protein
MNENTNERIDSYVEMYKNIWNKVSTGWSDYELEVSDRIFQEISKDLRSEMISQLRKRENKTEFRENESDETLATKKQRQTLHKFGIEKIPKNLSKDEASDILEELIDLSRHGNNQLLKEKAEELNEKWQGE